jgi:hypothetical protein
MREFSGGPMMTKLAVSIAACLVAASPAVAQEPSALAPPPVFLVGVVIPESGEAMAIVEDPQTREQTLHTVGAQIGAARLTKILRDRVVLSSGDVAIEVRLAGAPPPPPRVRVPTRPRPLPPRTRPIIPR